MLIGYSVIFEIGNYILLKGILEFLLKQYHVMSSIHSWIAGKNQSNCKIQKSSNCKISYYNHIKNCD